jgi:hypothetical protein
MFQTRDKGMAFRLFPGDEVGPGSRVEVSDGVVVSYEGFVSYKGFTASPDGWVLAVELLGASLVGGVGVNLISDWLIRKLNGSDVASVVISGGAVPLTKDDLDKAISEALAKGAGGRPAPPKRHVHEGTPEEEQPHKKRKKRRGRS